MSAPLTPEQVAPVVDREALAEALMTADMREHGWGHERDVALGWADALIASGVVRDTADVRREVSERFRAAAELTVQDVRAQRGDHIAGLVEDSFAAHFDAADPAHPRSP